MAEFNLRTFPQIPSTVHKTVDKSLFLQFTQYFFFFLKTYSLPGTVLGTGALVETEQKEPHGVYIWEENTYFPILD